MPWSMDRQSSRGEDQRTWVARMTAPRARKSVMWEVRLKGPVSHTPGGTYSSVPPRAPRRRPMRATARANAAVLSVRPSPRPPKLARDIHAPRRGGAGATPEHVSCAPADDSSSSSTGASKRSAGTGVRIVPGQVNEQAGEEDKPQKLRRPVLWVAVAVARQRRQAGRKAATI
ncbi:hypothetical protein U9M48_045018 [Paspalum notatum var. saurae]|uniref:Uncharacterized protein n=1 Tax=Paspalum notatum var. saurae TaxID=547442 RepID=A0AAQ3XI35_PASNO